MLRAAAALLVLVSVLLPTALAEEAPPGTDAPTPLSQALDRAGGALASGAASVADGAGAAAQGAAGLASAAAAGIARAAQALGHGLLAAATAVGAFLGFAFGLLGEGLAAAGRGLLALGKLVGHAALVAAGFLGGLLGDGARFARAHPVPTAVAAGSASAAGGLAWLLKRLGGLAFLAPLYTRLAPSRMLDNEARSSVYEYVKAHPGAHPSAISEKLDLGWGTVVYHLNKLEACKLVTTRSAHNRKCYFALTADLDAQARTAVAAMSTDKTRTIVEAVRASPGISQKELSERLGISQALASWHVKRLVDSGVLTTQREGRSNRLRVAQHVPAGASPLAA